MNQSDPAAPDLREYLAVLRHRKWLVIAVMAFVVGATVALTLRQTPLYTSEAQILVEPFTPQLGVVPRPVNLDTEAALVSSGSVTRLVARTQKASSPDALLSGLEVQSQPDTELINISYNDPDPSTAQRLAGALASAYFAVRRQQELTGLEVQKRAIRKEITRTQAAVETVDRQLADASDAKRRT